MITAGDVFNARDLQTQEVAEIFLPPPVFDRLLSNAHCILEGPRGSGKTTLLRMLTPEAFSILRRRMGGSCIDFIGVFVPADIRWAKQLTARTDLISDEVAKDALQHAVFSAAVSLALIEALENSRKLYSRFGSEQPKLFFEFNREIEAELIGVLADLWQLTVPVPSFNGIKLALRKRQHDLSHAAFLLAGGQNFDKIQQEFRYLTSTWLDNLVTAIETINDVLQRPHQRWAILLDELEIVPPSLLRTIVSALRSTSNLVRFKLALVPTGSDLIGQSEHGSSSHSEDYRSLKLWYERKGDARNFASSLFAVSLSRMLKREIPVENLASELGFSWAKPVDDDFDEANAGSLREIESPGLQKVRATAFSNLYDRDESFRKLLDDKKIDPRNPPYTDASANGILVRKITQLVVHREGELQKYSFADGAKRKGGRRNNDWYVGLPNIIDLTEGNPRWVLTLVEALVAAVREEGRKLSASSVQSGVVQEFVQQMISKLRVYPTGGVPVGRRWTPFDFIESLGMSQQVHLFDGPFPTDPPMSFIVDQEAVDQFGAYIRTAIDLGALIIMKRGGPAPLVAGGAVQSLVGSRVRLTYRLAPYFHIPLLSTKPQKLSAALKSGELFEQSENKAKSGARNKVINFNIDDAQTQPIQGRLL